jgi:hypothetical protein
MLSVVSQKTNSKIGRSMCKQAVEQRKGWSQGFGRVVFFFDEAAQLTKNEYAVGDTNRFQILRRALRILPHDEASIFAFVTATASMIANVSPSTRMESSQRAKNSENGLFPAPNDGHLARV